MHNGIEGFAVKPVAVVIHQVPNDVEFAVGGGAGERGQVRAVGGDAFDGITAVLLRQAGVKARANVNVVVYAVETELAQIAGGDGDRSSPHVKDFSAWVVQD